MLSSGFVTLDYSAQHHGKTRALADACKQIMAKFYQIQENGQSSVYLLVLLCMTRSIALKFIVFHVSIAKDTKIHGCKSCIIAQITPLTDR